MSRPPTGSLRVDTSALSNVAKQNKCVSNVHKQCPDAFQPIAACNSRTVDPEVFLTLTPSRTCCYRTMSHTHERLRSPPSPSNVTKQNKCVSNVHRQCPDAFQPRAACDSRTVDPEIFLTLTPSRTCCYRTMGNTHERLHPPLSETGAYAVWSRLVVESSNTGAGRRKASARLLYRKSIRSPVSRTTYLASG
jgi:hypothetical protein